MSTHYIEIRLLPDPEFSQSHLMGALYTKLHRALVVLRADDIGVNFPGYCRRPRGLGKILRLHGSEVALQQLIDADWLRGLRDHAALGDVRTIPADVQYRQLQRRQFKTSADRLRRRRMRRKAETFEQASIAIPDHVEQIPDLPYVEMRSQSTGQPFCLFLELSEPLSQAEAGRFNTYGLSTTATIPWF